MHILQAFREGLGHIIFVPSNKLTWLLFLCLCLYPSAFVCAAIAYLSAVLVVHIFEYHSELLSLHACHAVLTGLALAYHSDLSLELCALAALGGAVASVITALFYQVLTIRMQISLLSLPFIAATIVVVLAAYQLNIPLGLAAFNTATTSTSFWQAYTCSMGTLLFIPSLFVGTVLVCVLALHSPFLLLMSILGFSEWVFCATLFTTSEIAMQDGLAFNGPLIAIAAGGIVLTPSRRSLLCTFILVACGFFVAQAVQHLLGNSHIPVLALPFVCTVMPVMLLLRLQNNPLLCTQTGNTPEIRAIDRSVYAKRFPGTFCDIRLPFSGMWTVWQEPNGQWTHQGIWQHAYDFVMSDVNGLHYANDGMACDDHYAWMRPVLASTSGYVLAVVDGIADNPIGEVNTQQNWGNYVIISDPRGFEITIAHLACGSVRVTQGSWIAEGSVIGLCGNSGYSPLPHIHIQVQHGALPSAPTIPFSFRSYRVHNSFHSNNCPTLHERCAPVIPHVQVHAAMEPVLERQWSFNVVYTDGRTEQLYWSIHMNTLGQWFIQGEHGQLIIACDGGSWYALALHGNDPWLRTLFIALPRVPLHTQTNLSYTDYIPIHIFPGLASRLRQCAAVCFSGLASVPVQVQWKNKHLFRSTISTGFGHAQPQHFDICINHTGLVSLQTDSFSMRRIPYLIKEVSDVA